MRTPVVVYKYAAWKECDLKDNHDIQVHTEP